MYSINITPDSVVLNGKKLKTESHGSDLLKELYRTYVGDYPKFHKMDTLSRLGFIASELLLQSEAETEHSARFVPDESRAVVFGNRSASIANDTDYNRTIQRDNYYPSPALFVYTLPNIVTGEVAIRNHYYGETCFYVVDSMDDLLSIVETMDVESALVGWLECTNHDTFNAQMQILKR